MVADLLPRQGRSSLLALEGLPFVGRDTELADLAELVAECRLVTVTGEPGVGKTRLARRFAAHRAQFDGGVWFCDLSAARDAEGMCTALARTLSIADEVSRAGDGAAHAIGHALAARGRALVVLDNLEQLLPEGADRVLAWLDLAAEAHFLLTSRVALDVSGEEPFELWPLAVDAGEATDLFVERVRGRREGFAPEGDLAEAIAAVVRRVRGVPLAVELCAARFASERARVFTMYGDADRDPVGWSFSRLDEAERAALAQCSVFRGGFAMDAAERVVELPSSAHGGRASEVLASLVRSGLVQPAGGRRFMLCEGIRSATRAHLDESPEGAGAPWRHAQHYLALASGPLLDLPRAAGSATSRAELEPERENLEAVFDFGAAEGRRDLVLRAAVALEFLSPGRGMSAARIAGLDAALSAPDASSDPALIGRALGVRAAGLRAQGRLEEAERDARAALSIARRVGSTRQIVAMHLAVGDDRFQLGDLDEALAFTRAACQVARASGLGSEEALSLQQAGAVLQAMGEAAKAKAHYEAARDLARASGDAIAETRATMGLGSYYLEAGDLERAEASYDGALLLARQRGMARSVRIVMGYLGVLHLDAGRIQEAERWLDNAARSSRAAGDLRVEGIFEGIRGAALAGLDLVDEARAAFAQARELLDAHAYFAGVIDVYEGHLDLACAREARAEGEDERAARLLRAAAARATGAASARDGGLPLVRRSDDARIAVRILRRALARAG